MTAYAASKRRLATLRRPDKILITLFSVSLVIALVVGMLNYHQRTQLSTQGTEEWYRGNEADIDAKSMKFAKTIQLRLVASGNSGLESAAMP